MGNKIYIEWVENQQSARKNVLNILFHLRQFIILPIFPVKFMCPSAHLPSISILFFQPSTEIVNTIQVHLFIIVNRKNIKKMMHSIKLSMIDFVKNNLMINQKCWNQSHVQKIGIVMFVKTITMII